MRYFLVIKMDNEAFAENTAEEVRRILRDAVSRVELFSFGHLENRFPLRDANGNTVGFHGYENEEGRG